jgi:hypothetical protein
MIELNIKVMPESNNIREFRYSIDEKFEKSFQCNDFYHVFKFSKFRLLPLILAKDPIYDKVEEYNL